MCIKKRKGGLFPPEKALRVSIIFKDTILK